MQTESPPPILKLVLTLLVGACLLLAASACGQAMAGNWLPLAVAAVLWGPLAWGLWRRRRLARAVAVALLWLVVIVLPLGVINPFAAMDGAIDIEAPLWRLTLPVFAAVAAALFMLHVLGRHKTAFGDHGRR